MALFNEIMSVPGPNEQAKQQYAQFQTQLLPFIQKVLSGERIEGMTPKTAQRLMEVLSPSVVQTMYDRGYNVNPNWYQQYIRPGTVNPNMYSSVMQYALGFANAPSELASQAMNVWHEPVYQVGGYVPSYMQQQLQNWDTQVRMAMQGKVFDPYSGMWVEDPDRVWSQLSQAAGALQQDYLISQIMSAIRGELDTLFPNVVTTVGNTTTAANIPDFRGRNLSYQANQTNQAIPAQTFSSPAVNQSNQSQLVDNWKTQAEVVDLANKLRIGYPEAIRVWELVQEALASGASQDELARWLKDRYNVNLEDVVRIRPNWFVRNISWLRNQQPERR